MDNLEYLFSFDFEKGCMNDYVIDFCKRTKSDYFYSHLGVLYIDLYGTGIYNAIKIIHVVGCRNEVYYNTEKKEKNYFDRLYPQVEKAIKIEPYSNTYCIKANFENGDSITTIINGCKQTIERHYLNNIFDLSGDPERENFVRCNSIEFLEIIK